jgi:hypothetical protein
MNKISRREAITGIVGAGAAILTFDENSYGQTESPPARSAARTSRNLCHSIRLS